ncbi:MAG: efflux RND transporter periplasmic adaptor subunit [Woeseia sp.]
MRSNSLFILTFSLLGLVQAGCSGNAQEMAAYPPPAVSVVNVQPHSVPVEQEYVGRTMGSREVEVHARVTGIIEERLYEEGAAVRAGDSLFRLDRLPFAARAAAAEADLARARAEHARAAREHARLKPLVDAKAVSAKELDDASSDEALAAATVMQAEAALRDARIQLGYTDVRSPIDGITGLAQKFEGALVTAGTDSRLTTLVQLDPIDVHFSISENEWLRQQTDLASGAMENPGDAKLEVRIVLADGQVFDRVGQINFTAARIDDATGTYNVRARFDNPDQRLKAGQFVRVRVTGAERPNAIAVPQKAVLDSPQGKFVFVLGENEQQQTIAEIRPVTVGDWLTEEGGQMWLITSGLQAGERVIVDNFVKLAPGAPVTVLEAAEPAVAATL